MAGVDASRHSLPVTASNDESDWEYEYDETESEDFFVTLDLTVHVPPQYRAHHKPAPAQAPPSPALIDPTLDKGELPDGMGNTSAKGSVAAADRIQILELHSDNPLVSYQNKLYSCYWADALGTDLLFTTKSDNCAPHSAVYSTDSFSLLAATRARLIGRPVQMTERPTANAPKPALGGDGINPRDHMDATPLNAAADTAATAALIRSSKSRQGQARFLERLAAVKAARGERDTVPFNVGRTPSSDAARGRRSGGLNAGARDGDATTEDGVPSDEDDGRALDDHEHTLQSPRTKRGGELRGRRGRGRPRGTKRVSHGLLARMLTGDAPSEQDEVDMGNEGREPTSVAATPEAEKGAGVRDMNPSDSTPARWIHHIVPEYS